MISSFEEGRFCIVTYNHSQCTAVEFVLCFVLCFELITEEQLRDELLQLSELLPWSRAGRRFKLVYMRLTFVFAVLIYVKS